MLNPNVDFYKSGSQFANGLSMFADHQGNVDIGALRPWIDPSSGGSYITKYVGGDPKTPKATSPSPSSSATPPCAGMSGRCWTMPC